MLRSTAIAVPIAYESAAVKMGVNPNLLYAMALVESGQTRQGRYRPWPWTLNISGKPYFFNTREAAYKRLVSELEQDNENIAVGPLQIYWKYNKSYFEDAWEALNPYKNIEVGARILMYFYQKTGSFEKAVGAYNSPNNQTIAEQYKVMVRSKLIQVMKINNE